MLNMISEFDKRSFLAIGRVVHQQQLSRKAKLISSSGDGPLYLLVAVFFLLFSSKGQQLFDLIITSFLLELPLYFLLKNSVRRVRPCHSFTHVQLDFEPSDKFSLPSGHTAAAFVMATSVYIIFPIIGIFCFIWAVMIGVSRVALTVHYPTDIIAGAALGVSSVFVVL
ncbi:phosphatase PAP2 family protein [Parashewanella spongiae]|uniref:undecaprenyl-diphosphate phosphatase n=1 Tax=Parashewanella spongiae TaxID=342950 RepID=A0A3A6U2I9_9GAMM|nr:phosphatase PAP2 family protein [Parashewanella spongiae]MCL1079727.1 phosphatase PAP2 family protein [Parashewanella spongiae]RJY07105.1 phosphatase PAP2 family protein [Parashewanella spongiae]